MPPSRVDIAHDRPLTSGVREAIATDLRDCMATRDDAYADRHDFVQTGEALGAMLPSSVDIACHQSLMGGIREAISAGKL